MEDATIHNFDPSTMPITTWYINIYKVEVEHDGGGDIKE